MWFTGFKLKNNEPSSHTTTFYWALHWAYAHGLCEFECEFTCTEAAEGEKTTFLEITPSAATEQEHRGGGRTKWTRGQRWRAWSTTPASSGSRSGPAAGRSQVDLCLMRPLSAESPHPHCDALRTPQRSVFISSLSQSRLPQETQRRIYEAVLNHSFPPSLL